MTVPTTARDAAWKGEEEVLDELSRRAHAQARKSGFYDGFGRVQLDLLEPDDVEGDLNAKEHALRHNLSLLALIASEVGESVEAVRKPRAGEHIPDFTQEEEEIADVVIRIFDYSGFRGLRLGPAVAAKMAYNASRPRLHGKNS